jgi:hypothetical protein
MRVIIICAPLGENVLLCWLCYCFEEGKKYAFESEVSSNKYLSLAFVSHTNGSMHVGIIGENNRCVASVVSRFLTIDLISSE